MRSLLLILIIAIFISGNVNAKIYYVSPSGINTNSGLTPSLAWKTLTYAASSSSPVVAGDTVYIKSGNYGVEKVIFQKSGTAASPISYIGYQTTPGDAPPLLVNNSNPYAVFLSTDMPTYDGGNRASGIAFDCRKQSYLIIKNFQIQNYVYGLIAGATTQVAGNLTLYNINMMSLGDVNASYSGQGFLLGSMGTQFSNNNTLTNCQVVNSGAEGFDINGNNNKLTGCKAYCNENTANAPTDYYMIVTGSYNTFANCYIERAAGLSHGGHGYTAKTNAEQVVDQGQSLPAISAQYNKFYYCTAKNMGESFCVRHRTAQYNLFYHCKAIGTHTGASGSSGGEGNCIVTRDGASDNTFDGCIAENCNSGFIFVDTVEDGDTGTNPPGHPGNNNKYINCLIYNCYIGVKFDSYSVQSDAGDNTIAYCTFYKSRYLHYAARHCANMKYIGNIYHGCLPTASGGNFKEGTYHTDIVPNGTNTYFKNCNFINIEGGMPANFVSSSTGSIAADPLFVNSASLDFHLKATSPCKDAGVVLASINTDYDSILRPTGSGADIGAYEYQTTSPLSTSISSINVKCNGGSDGSATVTPTGGKAPYKYAWSNGQTNAISSGLNAGTYTVTVTDATPSSKTLTISITQPLAVTLNSTVQTNVSCNGGSEGSVILVASGGKSPYAYSWSNGRTTASVSGLIAGSYTVIVNDASACSKISVVSITEPLALVVSNTATQNVSCNGGNDGTATVSVSGGKSPYFYSWSNGQAAVSATGLAAGSYNVTVTDANTCSKIAAVSVTQPSVITLSSTVQKNISCNGGNDGTVTISATGGKSPYTYSWNNGQAAASATGLTAGSYTVTVTDMNACSKKTTVSIIEPAVLATSITAQTNVSYAGGSDGTATVSTSGGKSPYMYSWSNGQTTASATGLIAGSYVITVYDMNGCSKTASVLIAEFSSALTISSTGQINVSCKGGNDGRATVTASSGKSPYTYSWSNGQTTSSATGLIAGSYTVTVYDMNADSKKSVFSITEPQAIAISITAQTNVKCKGGSDGSVTVAANGGKSPYSYFWSNGKTTASILALTAGSYTVTVYDMNACSQSSTVLITEPGALKLTGTSQKDVSCNGGNNGNAEVIGSGGDGDYTYLWFPSGQTTAFVTGLTAYDHTVTVTDRMGCHGKKTVTISQPDPLVVDKVIITNPASCNSNDGNVRITAAGGTGHYWHHWNTSPPQTSDLASGLPAGQYVDIISDANTCSVVATVTVTCTSPTGVVNRSKADNELNVFPNPATGPFNISTPVQQPGKPILVVVRDLLGKEYYSKVLVVSNSEEIFTIDPSGALVPGVYLVIATSDDKLYERKIVVQ